MSQRWCAGTGEATRFALRYGRVPRIEMVPLGRFSFSLPGRHLRVGGRWLDAMKRCSLGDESVEKVRG
jgi:hypothetical protein